MGFFDFFGQNEKRNDVDNLQSMNWEVLESLDQLKKIEQESSELPIVIFKHSTRCGISSIALRQFEKDFDLPPNRIKIYYLDLLRYRTVSDAVAERLGIPHQSPQILVILDGSVVHHASHHNIDAKRLNSFIN